MYVTKPNAILGGITIAISLLSKAIGFPDQIRLNYRRKSTAGVSFSTWFLGLLAYSIWTYYGMLKHDRVIVWSQTLGIVLSGVVVGQFIVYSKNKGKESASYNDSISRNPRLDLISLVRGSFATPVISFLGRRGFLAALANTEINLSGNQDDQGDIVLLFRYLAALDLVIEVRPFEFRATKLGSTVFKRYGAFCLIDSYHDYFRDLDWVLAKRVKTRPVCNRERNVIGSGQLHARKFFPVILSHMASTPYEHLTDLGCGDGSFIHEALAIRPTLSITAVDLSETAINLVNERFLTDRSSNKFTSVVSCASDIATWASDPLVSAKVPQLITMWFVLHEIFNGEVTHLVDFFVRLQDRFPVARVAFGELIRLTPEEMVLNYRASIMPEYILFHALSGQRLLNEREFSALFDQIPYRLVHRYDFDPIVCGERNIPSSIVCILEPRSCQ